MISGATRGGGGSPLGKHLANEAKNETVTILESRGLVRDGIKDQIQELTDLGSHARTQSPIYHVHADPEPGTPWDDGTRDRYWKRFESEFGFQDQPFSGVRHVKDGREHEHRVYLRTRPDGSSIRLDHDYARIEKIGRLHEHEESLPLTLGAHNRSVIQALEKDGRADVAQHMRDLGFDTAERPRAPISPAERAMQERTGILQTDVDRQVLSAWKSADSPAARKAALEDAGFRMAIGDRGAILIDASGGVHSLSKVIGRASKATDGARLKAGDVRDGIAGLELSTYVARAGDDRPQPDSKEAGLAEEEVLADPSPSISTEETPTAAPEAVPGDAPAVEQPAIVIVDVAAPVPPAEAGGGAGASGGGGGEEGKSASPASTGSQSIDTENNIFVPVLGEGFDAMVRYFRAWEAFEKKNQAISKAISEQFKGKPYAKATDDFIKEYEKYRDRAGLFDDILAQIAEYRAAKKSENPSLEHGRSETAGIYDGRQAGFNTERSRQTRDESDSVRSSNERNTGRRTASIIEFTGAKGRRGIEDGSPDNGFRESVGEPGADRIKTGIDRIENANFKSALASTKTDDAIERIRIKIAALSGPIDPVIAQKHLVEQYNNQPKSDQVGWEKFLKDRTASGDPAARDIYHRGLEVRAAKVRLESAIVTSDGRAGEVLARRPHTAPGALDLGRVVTEGRTRLLDQIKADQIRADDLAVQAKSSQAKVGILDRLVGVIGIETVSLRMARQAADAAETAKISVEVSRETYPRDAREADERAPGELKERRRQQNRFDASPGAQRAADEIHGNRLIREALDRGDPEIRSLADRNLRAAREEVLKRERELHEAALERDRRAEEVRRRQDNDNRKSDAVAPAGASPAPAPSPFRFR